MDGVKIGGIYYGTDIQKAMEKANRIVTNAAIKVYENDYDVKNITVAIECYEKAFIEMLKQGGE